MVTLRKLHVKIIKYQFISRWSYCVRWGYVQGRIQRREFSKSETIIRSFLTMTELVLEYSLKFKKLYRYKARQGRTSFSDLPSIYYCSVFQYLTSSSWYPVFILYVYIKKKNMYPKSSIVFHQIFYINFIFTTLFFCSSFTFTTQHSNKVV